MANHDFVIFDPTRAPNDRKTLRDWCRQQLEWEEAQNGDDQHVASEALLAWHVDMAKGYQVPWGPIVRMVSCRLAETAIHVSFSRTKTNDAQRAVDDLARRHSVGFVVTSSPCQEVWLPYDHYMGLTMQLRPKTIDASDILNARAWQRGLNSFIVTSGDFDNRSAFLRFAVYKEQLSQAWGRPETVSRYCVWWRSPNDPLETINLKIEDNTDVLLVMHVS